jgi:hypothetical protein
MAADRLMNAGKLYGSFDGLVKRIKMHMMPPLHAGSGINR